MQIFRKIMKGKGMLKARAYDDQQAYIIVMQDQAKDTLITSLAEWGGERTEENIQKMVKAVENAQVWKQMVEEAQLKEVARLTARFERSLEG
jgi:hypothetical protein